MENNTEKIENLDNSEELNYTGKIDKIYIKKSVMAVFWGMTFLIVIPVILFTIPVFIFVDPIIYLIINASMVGFTALMMWLTKFLNTIYVRNFSYEISNKFIVIRSGILSRTKTTIPFSRIQNVNIHQGILDRIYNIYTVSIETAGAHAPAQGGRYIRAEGYLPGLSDISRLETITNKLVHEYTQENVPNSLKGMIFEDHNVAFDQFIAYILSKMTWGEDMKTKIKELRKANNMTQAELAEKINVTRQTINYLEQGKYIPSLPTAILIADVFDVNVRDIFTLEKNDQKKK